MEHTTTPRPTSPRYPASRVVSAVVGGAATIGWYASADVVRSRTARGWVKAGCLALGVAAGLPELRRERAAAAELSARARRAARVDDLPDGLDAPDANSTDEDVEVGPAVREALRELPAGKRVALVAVTAGVVAGTTVATVATERWLFRRGEVRRAAGDRWAHTRTGLVLGLASTALGMIPSSDDTEHDDTDGDAATGTDARHAA